MGAFVITLLITRIARKFLGYDARGSIAAFLIALAITVGLGSSGFSSESVPPLQALPFVALGYGKFCLAFLIIDLDFAKRLKANPELIKTVGNIKPSPTTAWIPAVLVIAIGAAVSFILPGAQPNWLARTGENTSAPPTSMHIAPERQPLSSAAGLFTVWMPSEATETSELVHNPTGRPDLLGHMFMADMRDSAYSLTYVRFKDSQIDPSATAERVLESTRDGMLRAISGAVTEQHHFDYQGYPALDVSFTFPVAQTIESGRSRMVMAGRTAYGLIAFGGSPATATRFLDSFVITATSDGLRLPVGVATTPP